MSRKIHYLVVEPDGTTCPRCEQVAETRKHIAITEKQLNQPFYFRYWYFCKNEACATKLFMLEDWKVWNKNSAAREFKIVQESQQLEDRFRGLF